MYLLLPGRSYYWDGVASAIAIERGYTLGQLLHPNHLLYMPAGRVLWLAVEALGIPTRALFVLQWANSVLAAACVALMFGSLREAGAGRAAALAGALVLAFSATWWKFATDAGAYIPAIFLMLCAWRLAARGRGIAAALAVAGAMLFHELAILFLPAALMRAPAKRRAPAAALSLGVVFLAYAAAYRVVSGSWRMAGFAAWVVSHSPDSGFSWNPLRGAALGLLGTLRLFFGGRPDALEPGALSVAMLSGVAASAGAIAYWLRSAERPRLKPPPRAAVLWVAAYALFLLAWMPRNTFYRLFYLPPLLLICASLEWPATGARLAGALAALLLSWNLAFVIYPGSRVERNAPLACARQFAPDWPAGTPIVFHRFHPDLWTISYFNPQAAWIGLERDDPGELDRACAYARSEHAPLWLEATAYDFLNASPAGQAWLRAHPPVRPPLIYRDARHEFRFHALEPGP